MGKGKENQKVAYTVFKGVTPGVYETWSNPPLMELIDHIVTFHRNETERHVKGFSSAKYRGYTVRDGGRQQAEKDYNECHKGTQIITNFLAGDSNGTNRTSSKKPETTSSMKACGEGPAAGQSKPKPRRKSIIIVNEDSSTFNASTISPLLSPEATKSTSQETLPGLNLSYKHKESTPSKPLAQTPQAPHVVPLRKKRQRNGSGVIVEGDQHAKSPRFSAPLYPPLPIGGHGQEYHHHGLPISYMQREGVPPNTVMMDPEILGYPSPVRSNEDESETNSAPGVIDLEDEDSSKSSFKQSMYTNTEQDYIPFPSSDYGGFPNYPELPPPPPLRPAPLVTEPELCKEQADLVNLIVSGANVFYTGSAGCGKSTVLRSFVKQLKEHGKTVKIIAPTGRSALDVSGTTFWTFAGWHPDSMKVPLDRLEHNARFHKNVRDRLCETDVLVVDEISMFENQHFERLNRIMKAARSYGGRFDVAQARENYKAPFGGVQMVVTGDFCQLPPVRPFKYCMYCGRTLFTGQDQEGYTCTEHGKFYDIDKWTFRSAAWQECNFMHVNLKQIHRQSDKEFITILNKFRFGIPLSVDDKDLLLSHPSETTDAVKLFPLVREVREVNSEEFARLKGPTLAFDCLDDYHWNKEHESLKNYWQRSEDKKTLKALDHHRFEPSIQLRPKMLVVLLVNLDINRGLVNGSQGVVLGFKTHDPAQLAEQVGEHASRKKEQIKKFVDRAEVKQWPLVRFHNGVTRLIKAHCVISELGESTPYSLISRTQIPLLAAWAMTIHKSQGMTLSRVDVNISKVFEKGQGYVALSRATSLQGLNVRALGDCNQRGNEQVMEFLEEKFGKDVIAGMVAGNMGPE